MTFSLFQRDFVSDGYFDDAFASATTRLKRLDLARVVDVLFLAREQITYTKNPDSSGMIIGHLQVDLLFNRVENIDTPHIWQLSATGTGLSKDVALKTAEEAVIKDLLQSPKIFP